MGWIECPACRLKHTARPDGACPRCSFRIAPPIAAVPAAGAPSAAVGPPVPARAYPPAPVAPPAPARAYPPAAVGPPVPARTYPPARPFAPALPATRRELTIGGLFTGTFSAWSGSAGAVLPLLALFGVLSGLVTWQMMLALGANGDWPQLPKFFLMLAVLFLLEPPQMMMAVRAGMRQAAGVPAELGDSLAAVGRTYFPVLVVNLALLILYAVAGALVRFLQRASYAVFPFMFMLSRVLDRSWPVLIAIPVLYLFTAWTVSVPAMAAEELGPFAALRRSWVLTRGRRGRIFVAFLLIILCGAIAAFGVQVGGTWLLAQAFRGLGSRDLMAVLMVVGVVIWTLVGSILSVATGVAYHLLRVEPREDDGLGRVFE
jgi:hypothetical protein